MRPDVGREGTIEIKIKIKIKIKIEMEIEIQTNTGLCGPTLSRLGRAFLVDRGGTRRTRQGARSSNRNWS